MCFVVASKMENKKMENTETNSNVDKDKKNWKLKFFYYNSLDKRMIVPSRNPVFGPTLNFASPYTAILLVAVVVLVILMALIPDLIAGR
jgi:uncharacterized membrane protein